MNDGCLLGAGSVLGVESSCRHRLSPHCAECGLRPSSVLAALLACRLLSCGGFRTGAQWKKHRAELLWGHCEHFFPGFTLGHKMRTLIRTPEIHLQPCLSPGVCLLYEMGLRCHEEKMPSDKRALVADSSAQHLRTLEETGGNLFLR